MKTTLLPGAILLALFGAAHAGRCADDDGGPAVVPYRPSVSTPAQLSAPGYLELEAGGLAAHGDPTRYTLPYTLKLAFTPDWGIRIGGDALVRQQGVPTGVGDTAVVLKRRFAISDATAWGLELGEKLPSAGSERGSGHADTTVNAIFSSDFAPTWHTDLNLNETRLGVDSGPARRLADGLGRGLLQVGHRRLGRGGRALGHAPVGHAQHRAVPGRRQLEPVACRGVRLRRRARPQRRHAALAGVRRRHGAAGEGVLSLAQPRAVDSIRIRP